MEGINVTIDVPEPWLTWTPGSTLAMVERRAILECLTFHKGNRTYTAVALKISLRTLRNKLSEYRITGHEVPETRFDWAKKERKAP